MFNLTEYRRSPQALSDWLPWALLLRPNLLLNKDGSIQTTICFRGIDAKTTTATEQAAFRAQTNQAFKRFGSGWCIHVDATRRADTAYPTGQFDHPLAAAIDEERRTSLETRYSYTSRQFVTFTLLLPNDYGQKLLDLLLTNPQRSGRQSKASPLAAQIDEFERSVTNIVNILASVLPEVRRLDADETLSYLHDCISDRPLAVKCPAIPCYLDALLSDTPLVGGMQPRLGRNHLQTIAVRAYTPTTLPLLLDALNDLPFEYRWVARFIPLGREDAASELQRSRRHWFARRKAIWTLLREFLTQTESPLIEPEAVLKGAEVDEALAALGGEHCSFGYTTVTVTTWHTNPDQLERNARSIQRVIDSTGLVSRFEDLNAVQAFLGSQPGNAYADVRRPLLSTLNLCDLIPVSSVYCGQSRDEHLDGPPLMQLHTNGSSPFRFALHQAGVGHTVVLGPTGMGKSTLLRFTEVQSQRYPGTQVYTFDRGRSARTLTLAMDGDYYALTPEATSLSFQPLSQLDQLGELAWANDWLLSLFAEQNYVPNAAEKEHLWSALTSLARLPRPQRTLTTLCEVVQVQALRELLQPFTLTGPYGKLLDSAEDRLSEGLWQTFELEALIDHPLALAAVLPYLFHRLEQRFGSFVTRPDGTLQPRLTLLVIDEAWMLLQLKHFGGQIRTWLKTLRKKNVAVILATQSLADIVDSPLASAILESCPNRIFLPNPAALEPATLRYYRDLGLNDRQIAIIQSATPRRDYFYVSREGSRLFQLELGPLAKALCASGTATEQALVERLMGVSTRESFASAFLDQCGLPHWAERIRGARNVGVSQ